MARAATCWSTSTRRLGDDVGRLLRRHASRAPAASATPSDASWSTRRSDRLAAPGSRGRGRASGSRARRAAVATASLAAIIRCSISRCDSVARRPASTTWPRAVEGELRLDALDRQRAAALAPGLQRRRRRPRGRERLRPRLLRVLRAGEDPVDPVVVQPLVRADRRAVEGRFDALRAAQLELDGDRQAVDVRAQRAGVVRQRLGQHRLDRARHVDAGRAAVGLAVDRRARAHVGRDVGDVDPDAPAARRRAPRHEIASSKSRAVTGSIVNVASSRQVAARRRRAARPPPPPPARPRRERAAQAAVEHQRLDHVAGDVRTPEHARDLRAAALARWAAAAAEAPRARVARALDRHAGGPARRTARR